MLYMLACNSRIRAATHEIRRKLAKRARTRASSIFQFRFDTPCVTTPLFVFGNQDSFRFASSVILQGRFRIWFFLFCRLRLILSFCDLFVGHFPILGSFQYTMHTMQSFSTPPRNIRELCRAITVSASKQQSLCSPVVFFCRTDSHRFNKTRLFLPTV